MHDLRRAALQALNVPEHLLRPRVVAGFLVLVRSASQKLRRPSFLSPDFRRLSRPEVLANVARHALRAYAFLMYASNSWRWSAMFQGSLA